MDETAEEWAEVEAWVEEHSQDLLEANLVYLWTAGALGVTALLELFVYKWQVTVDGTDADGETETREYIYNYDYTMRAAEYTDTMYNRQAGQILAYGNLAIYGSAMITQLLSMLGIAVAVNGMVWWYGVAMGTGIVTLIASYYFMAGMQKGWAFCNETYDDPSDVDSTDATECAAWNTYIAILEANAKGMVEKETATMIALGAYMENWMLAQWWALPEEERYEMWLEKKDDEHDKMFAKLH